MSTRDLYIDSSVIGGYFDAEWKDATRELWKQWRAGKWRFLTSTTTAAEMLGAPAKVRRLFEATFVPEDLLVVGMAVDALAMAYLEAKVVPRKYSDDARHVAACVRHGCLLLVSWNFRHLANVNREAGFNAVNLLMGLPTLRIVSPLELIYEDEAENP